MRAAGAAEPAAARQTLLILLNSCTRYLEGKGQLLLPVSQWRKARLGAGSKGGAGGQPNALPFCPAETQLAPGGGEQTGGEAQEAALCQHAPWLAAIDPLPLPSPG